MKGFIITVTVIICITFVSCTQNSQQKEILNKVFKSNPLLEECSKSIEPHQEKCNLDSCNFFGCHESTEESLCYTIWGTFCCILSWVEKLCDILALQQFKVQFDLAAEAIELNMCKLYPRSDVLSCDFDDLNSTTISSTEETDTTEVVDTTTKGPLPGFPPNLKLPLGIFEDLPDVIHCVIGCPPKQTELNNRIIGGSYAKDGEIPYQCGVIAVDLNPLGPICGCSIHNKTTVITAGHCCKPIIKFPIIGYIAKIAYNTNQLCLSLAIPPFYASIKELHIHPEYNDTTVVNDICVISLGEELNLPPDKTNLIEIAQTEPADGTPLLVSGWGLTNVSAIFQPTCLKKLDLKVFNRQQCSNMFGNSNDTINRVDNSTICAITPIVPAVNQDTYQGDSGGPLVYKDEKNVTRLVGIVSKGVGGEEGYPSIYSSVPYLKNFILYGTP